MLARYMQSSCVCPSVRPPLPVLYRNDWTNQAGFWQDSFFRLIPHCVIRKFGELRLKIKVLPSGTLFQTLELEMSPGQIDGVVDKTRRRSSLWIARGR